LFKNNIDSDVQYKIEDFDFHEIFEADFYKDLDDPSVTVSLNELFEASELELKNKVLIHKE